jgi:nitrite reductase (NO-forming)
MTRIFIFISAFVSMALLTLIYTQVAQQPAVAQVDNGGANQGTLEIHAFDLGFKPNMLHVPNPGRYTIKLVNDGKMPHDFASAEGTVVVAAQPGETVTAEIDVPAAGFDFICSIPGHAAAGMTGSIMVDGGTAARPDATAAPSMGDHGGPGAALPAKDPNAPKYELRDPAAPKAMSGKVHDITLVTEEKLMTVADGYVQKVWTFNGTVPGPVLRVKVGDTVRVHLQNPATSQMNHSIDFHASMVAWNDEMTDIAPGQEKLYEFKAEHAGVWMYHCGTAPTLHHIANGMYGMIIVEPTEGLPPVDAEYAIVQSEWYLGPQGQPVDLTKASAGAPDPDFVVFNGVANQYKDNPIKVKTGARIRIFLLDAGPSVDSSFHIVGTIFDDVIKEGIHLKRGNDGNWGSQAVDLAPAQGAIVEFRLAEDGLYPFVNHAFNFVGHGAIGLFQAGDGDPAN